MISYALLFCAFEWFSRQRIREKMSKIEFAYVWDVRVKKKRRHKSARVYIFCARLTARMRGSRLAVACLRDLSTLCLWRVVYTASKKRATESAKKSVCIGTSRPDSSLDVPMIPTCARERDSPLVPFLSQVTHTYTSIFIFLCLDVYIDEKDGREKVSTIYTNQANELKTRGTEWTLSKSSSSFNYSKLFSYSWWIYEYRLR